MEPLLTTEDVADFFRVDVVTVRRMIGKRELTAYRVGGEYRFARSDIEAYLDRQRVPARAEGTPRLRKLSLPGVRKSTPLTPPQHTFECFTTRAQTALSLAQEEALSLGSPCIGTEHLLLGILREGEGMGARLLGEAGCDLDGVRKYVLDRGTGGPRREVAQGEMPVTPRLKKVLQLAVDEARRLDHDFVGTEHLVLGILHEEEGTAGSLLRDAGMDLDATRRRVKDTPARRASPTTDEDE